MSKFKYEDFSYQDYTDSGETQSYKDRLAAAEATKPIDSQSSVYEAAMAKTLNDYQNYKDFKYDMNEDPVYQQYRDKYVAQGKQAMADTMGQAATMTGGYGNSYAQTVGNQAYQASLQELNNIVPQLYEMAYSKYRDEKGDLLNVYSMQSDQYSRSYAQYRDSVADWQNQRDYLANQYNASKTFDYAKYSDDRNFAWNQYSSNRDFAYTDYRNDIADEQWTKEYNESVRQFNETNKLNWANYNESVRHNKAGESYNNAALAETRRHNQASESISRASLKKSNGTVGSTGSGGGDDNKKKVRAEATANAKNAVATLPTRREYSRYAKSQYNGMSYDQYVDWECQRRGLSESEEAYVLLNLNAV